MSGWEVGWYYDYEFNWHTLPPQVAEQIVGSPASELKSVAEWNFRWLTITTTKKDILLGIYSHSEHNFKYKGFCLFVWTSKLWLRVDKVRPWDEHLGYRRRKVDTHTHIYIYISWIGNGMVKIASK